MPRSHLSGRLRWRASVTDTAKRIYAVVFERAPNNYAAYCPDVLGCVSVGDNWPEMLAMIREALEFHIEGMLEDGDALPEPTMSIRDAIRSHGELINEVDDDRPNAADEAPVTEVTFTMVDVNVKVPDPADTAEAVGVGD